jgi:glycosyltransferase involved in cell wall biosynthesis
LPSGSFFFWMILPLPHSGVSGRVIVHCRSHGKISIAFSCDSCSMNPVRMRSSMAQRALISIVIPAYNAERFIGQTLQSICDQTVTDWECVVVNDGSTDNTAQVVREIAQRDDRIRVIEQINAGPAAARNTGMASVSAGSQFICFMDNDDVWLPDSLAVLREALEANPQCIAAHGLADTIDENGNPMDHKRADGGFLNFGRRRMVCENGRLVPCDLSKPTTFESLYPVSRLFPSGLVLIRHDVMRKVGGFDTTYWQTEDWDMWLRLARVGEFHFINRIVLHYRRHSSNQSSNMTANAREVRRLLCKHYFSKENNPRQRQIVRHGFRAWQLARMAEKSASAREHWHAGRYWHAVKLSLEVGLHAMLYVRGFPTPLGI